MNEWSLILKHSCYFYVVIDVQYVKNGEGIFSGPYITYVHSHSESNKGDLDPIFATVTAIELFPCIASFPFS